MKIKYIAEDGKEFDTENECYEYEKSCVLDYPLMLDLELKPVPIEDFGSECFYVNIKTEEQGILLNKEVGAEPFKVGIYAFLDGGWTTIDEEIERLENIKKELSK